MADTQRDIQIITPDAWDSTVPVAVNNQWGMMEADGTLYTFPTEDAACAFQRGWRMARGLDPMTGEPTPMTDDIFHLQSHTCDWCGEKIEPHELVIDQGPHGEVYGYYHPVCNERAAEWREQIDLKWPTNGHDDRGER